jgi:hypothetical protein
MNVDVALLKRLSTLHTHLRSAAGYLDAPVPPHIPEHVPLAQTLELLSEPALIAWMTELAEAGAGGRPKAAFWRILEKAAEAVGSQERSVEYRVQFLAAVADKDGR